MTTAHRDEASLTEPCNRSEHLCYPEFSRHAAPPAKLVCRTGPYRLYSLVLFQPSSDARLQHMLRGLRHSVLSQPLLHASKSKRSRRGKSVGRRHNRSDAIRSSVAAPVAALSPKHRVRKESNIVTATFMLLQHSAGKSLAHSRSPFSKPSNFVLRCKKLLSGARRAAILLAGSQLGDLFAGQPSRERAGGQCHLSVRFSHPRPAHAKATIGASVSHDELHLWSQAGICRARDLMGRNGCGRTQFAIICPLCQSDNLPRSAKHHNGLKQLF